LLDFEISTVALVAFNKRVMTNQSFSQIP